MNLHADRRKHICVYLFRLCISESHVAQPSVASPLSISSTNTSMFTILFSNNYLSDSIELHRLQKTGSGRWKTMVGSVEE